MQGVSISKINLSKVLVFDVDLFPCSHGQGYSLSWAVWRAVNCVAASYSKIAIFLIFPTISTLIARNNYILTRLRLSFCYHHNDSIILNYWRPLTVRLKQCHQERIYIQGVRQWEIPWSSKVSLQDDVVKSGEFFHSFLYQFTGSNFFLL